MKNNFKKTNLLYEKQNLAKTWGVGFLYIVLGSLFIAYFLFVWVYASTPVLGTSMMPNLNPKGANKSDIVYINRFVKGTYGDIIVIDQGKDYGDSRYIVKRLIAKENDRVRFEQDKTDNEFYLFLNGKKIVENYLFNYHTSGDPANTGNTKSYENMETLKLTRPELFDVEGNLVVPKGYIFALGDNRGVSLDSSMKGPFLRETIVGKVDFVVPYGVSEFKFLMNRFTIFNFKLS